MATEIGHIVSNCENGVVLQRITYSTGDTVEVIFESDGNEKITRAKDSNCIADDSPAIEECACNSVTSDASSTESTYAADSSNSSSTCDTACVGRQKMKNDYVPICLREKALKVPPTAGKNNFVNETSSNVCCQRFAQTAGIVFYYLGYLTLCILAIFLQKPYEIEGAHSMQFRVPLSVSSDRRCHKNPLCVSMIYIPEIEDEYYRYYPNNTAARLSTDNMNANLTMDFRPAILAALTRINNECNEKIRVITNKNRTVQWPQKNLTYLSSDVNLFDKGYRALKLSAFYLQSMCSEEVGLLLGAGFHKFDINSRDIKGIHVKGDPCNARPSDFHNYVTVMSNEPREFCFLDLGNIKRRYEQVQKFVLK